MNLLDAVVFAIKAHDGQTRKFSGEPFVLHPIRVARTVAEQGYGTHAQVAAVLHDIVEDTTVTFYDLEQAGVEPYVILTVDALTRRPGETYQEFIQRIKEASALTADAIKLADIRDNLSSLPNTGEYKSLRKRYLKAIKTLENK